MHRDRETQIRHSLLASHLPIPNDPRLPSGRLVGDMVQKLSPCELPAPLYELLLVPIFRVTFSGYCFIFHWIFAFRAILYTGVIPFTG